MQSMPTRIGKYEIISRLGHGGMGEVYKAFHPQLHRYVALKFLLTTAETDPDFIARFQQEAQAVARLRHPHIVQVFDFDVQDGKPFMVMEFVEGETLAQRLTRLHRGGQVLPISEVVQIFQQLCSAVDYAHKQGMLHRDLKPQNVLINAQGEAVLTDFGLAKIMGVSGLTASNTVMGTPHYMSPEQAQGQPVDTRSDVYSLGVMLYESLAGKVPFDASTPVAVLMQQVTMPPPPILEVNPAAPAGLSQIAMIAMAKRPEQRFQSAGAMGRAVAESKNNESVIGAAAQSALGGSGPAAASVSQLATVLEPTQGRVAQQSPQTGMGDPRLTPNLTGQAPVGAPAGVTPPPSRRLKRRSRFALVGLIVLLLLVGGGVLAFALVNQTPKTTSTAAAASIGTVSFTASDPHDFNHPANVLTGVFPGLTAPPGTSTDFAWLCGPGANGAQSSCALMGPLLQNQSGKWAVTKTQADNLLGSQATQTALTFEITQEQTEPSSPPAAPSSHVVYTGKLDAAVLLHIRHQLSAFGKLAPFDHDMTALDTGFGNDAVLLQNLAQQMQTGQSRGQLHYMQQIAGNILSLISGNPNGKPGPAGDDGFGMGSVAPACTSAATTTYLPLVVEHACFAYKAGNTPALQNTFNQLQQKGADAASAITAIQQIAMGAQNANDVHQVDVTTLMQKAQQVLNDAYSIMAFSEQMAIITIFPA